jgi:hypothetical protein
MSTKGGIKKGIRMKWSQQLVVLEKSIKQCFVYAWKFTEIHSHSPNRLAPRNKDCKRNEKTERKIMYFRNKPIKDVIIAAINKTQVYSQLFLPGNQQFRAGCNSLSAEKNVHFFCA